MAASMTGDDLIAKLKVTSVEEMRKEYPHGVKIEQMPYARIRCVYDDDGCRIMISNRTRTPMTDRQLDKLAHEIPGFLEKYEWVFKPNPHDALQIWMMGKRQDQALSRLVRGTQKSLDDALSKITTLLGVAENVFGRGHPVTCCVENNWTALAMPMVDGWA
jgi:hypothetical protein